jgi:hypothetical protein
MTNVVADTGEVDAIRQYQVSDRQPLLLEMRLIPFIATRCNNEPFLDLQSCSSSSIRESCAECN